jgi:hypothetical protein
MHPPRNPHEEATWPPDSHVPPSAMNPPTEGALTTRQERHQSPAERYSVLSGHPSSNLAFGVSRSRSYMDEAYMEGRGYGEAGESQPLRSWRKLAHALNTRFAYEQSLDRLMPQLLRMMEYKRHAITGEQTLL